ncbi:MAG: hypothetical protein K2Y37_04405 [Pirellulales bacterium]|nr:hypothetical protein [Pirellulales bacterium]
MHDNPYATTCDISAGRVSTAPKLALFAAAWFVCVWSQSGFFAYLHFSEHEPPGTKLVVLVLLGTSLFGGPLFAIAAPWNWTVKVLLTIVTPIAILAQWVLFTWLSLETHGLKLD